MPAKERSVSSLSKARLKALSGVEFVYYMASGRVTVARVTQVMGNSLKHSYCAKIRGIPLGKKGEGMCLFDNAEAARSYGMSALIRFRRHREEYEA